jgi:hypothetical protein
MSKIRQLSMAAALALTLGVPVFAGITDTPPAPPPPPPDPIIFTGTIDRLPVAQSANGPADPYVSLTLMLFHGVLSAF